MKRWNSQELYTAGIALFAQIARRKRYLQHNHDVHILRREIEQWLSRGCQALVEGRYTPQCLRRYYFTEEVVEQFSLSDRVLQRLILTQLKPTFRHVISPHCYHLAGPNSIKTITQQIQTVLQQQPPAYFIRADVRSFYKSIPHFKLIQDLKTIYQDPKLINMLENIITNPIESPNGYHNPVQGIPVRGPLSPFFSAIYLKPLDDAMSKMQVVYFRYQDDILILCQTKRQMLRARRRMMSVLHERYLRLSRKKTRMGAMLKPFHFLGIQYSPTRPEKTHPKARERKPDMIHSSNSQSNEAAIMPPATRAAVHLSLHPRTLRRARMNIQSMVNDGLSATTIRNYSQRWARWWGRIEIRSRSREGGSRGQGKYGKLQGLGKYETCP